MDLKQLQEKRERLANLMREHAKTEAKWNASDKERWAKLNAAYNENQKKIDTAVRQQKHASNDAGRKPGSGGDRGLTDGPVNVDQFQGHTKEFKADQAIALQGWFLNNAPSMSHLVNAKHHAAAKRLRVNLQDREIVLRIGSTSDFRRNQAPFKIGARTNQFGQVQNAGLQAGLGSTGGFTIGETLMAKMEQAMLDYSGVLQVAEVIRTTTGEIIRWPTVDDTGNTGSRVGESADAGTASNPTFGRLNLSAHTYTSGQLNVSRSLLTDSIMDMEGLVGEMMGVRIGRKQNTDFTTGTGGGNAPLGIVTASSAGKTAASATAIAFDELIDLAHSVDPAYRSQPGVGYMFNDGILQVIRKLKDGNGQYLWTNGTQAGEPDRLNGFPFWINQAMQSTVATATKTVLFGWLSQYKVRQVDEVRIQRLIERRAEYDEDAFIAYVRADGGLLNPGVNPVKHLVQA